MNHLFNKLLAVIVILSLLLCVSCGTAKTAQNTESTANSESHVDNQMNIDMAETDFNKETKESTEVVDTKDESKISSSVSTEESTVEENISSNKPVNDQKNKVEQSKPNNKTESNNVQAENDASTNSESKKPDKEEPDMNAPDNDQPEQLPWENGGKQPSEYTWAEFEALTAGQQMAFQNSFGNIEAFDAWMQKAQGNESVETDLPWENGGKQPADYTWAEFEALTAAQQMAFQNSFGNVEAFDAWLQKTQGSESVETDLPWENGGKRPTDYTWAEFEALTAGQQMAFQNSFGSVEAFDSWLQKAQGSESVETDLPWENGGKQPAEYTWAEFEALTAGQQMAFQKSFGNIEAFDAWLQKAQESESEKIELPWENGGKQPAEYTWAEFEALTAGQQMAFQNSFGNIENFDKWLTAKQP